GWRLSQYTCSRRKSLLDEFMPAGFGYPESKNNIPGQPFSHPGNLAKSSLSPISPHTVSPRFLFSAREAGTLFDCG
ncbi:MAG: hypothetical protein ACRD4I_16355, partial [Candidatus Angelobacter sp.]